MKKFYVAALASIILFASSSYVFASHISSLKFTGVSVVNHALVNRVSYLQGGGVTGDYFITRFSSGNVQFQTIDQLVCNTGNFEVKTQIIDADSEEVIATLPPYYINSNKPGYIFREVGTWRVYLDAGRWYNYQIYVNGELTQEFSF
jgi:hypothetical protein